MRPYHVLLIGVLMLLASGCSAVQYVLTPEFSVKNSAREKEIVRELKLIYSEVKLVNYSNEPVRTLIEFYLPTDVDPFRKDLLRKKWVHLETDIEPFNSRKVKLPKGGRFEVQVDVLLHPHHHDVKIADTRDIFPTVVDVTPYGVMRVQPSITKPTKIQKTVIFLNNPWPGDITVSWKEKQGYTRLKERVREDERNIWIENKLAVGETPRRVLVPAGSPAGQISLPPGKYTLDYAFNGKQYAGLYIQVMGNGRIYDEFGRKEIFDPITFPQPEPFMVSDEAIRIPNPYNSQ